MLQELAARTAASTWVIGAMLFFIAVWVAIAIGVARARPEDMEARARLALDDERTPGGGEQRSGTKA